MNRPHAGASVPVGNPLEPAPPESAELRGYPIGAARTVKHPSQTVIDAKKRSQEAIRRMKMQRDTGTGWPSSPIPPRTLRYA